MFRLLSKVTGKLLIESGLGDQDLPTGAAGKTDLPCGGRETATGYYGSAIGRLRSVNRVIHTCCYPRSDLGIVTTIGATYRRTVTASTTGDGRGEAGRDSNYRFVNVSNGQDRSGRYIDLPRREHRAPSLL